MVFVKKNLEGRLKADAGKVLMEGGWSSKICCPGFFPDFAGNHEGIGRRRSAVEGSPYLFILYRPSAGFLWLKPAIQENPKTFKKGWDINRT